MSVKFHEAYALDSQQDQLLWWDDFLGDQIQDEWNAGGNGAAAVVDQQTGGIVRITTGAVSGNDYRLDHGNIKTLLVSKRASIEFRTKLNQNTNLFPTLGLLDNNAFQDFIRFYFDTGAGHTDWWIQTGDGGVFTGANSGVAFDTDYHIFRIECHTHGSNHVHFYIDGTETANSPITTNVPDDATDYLQPYMRLRTREDLAKSMDTDYVVVRQEI